MMGSGESMESQYRNDEYGLVIIDMDTIFINESVEAEDDHFDKGDLRKWYLNTRIRQWEKDEFMKLTDEELQEMETWDRSWLEKLEVITRNERVRLVLLSVKDINPEHIIAMAKFRNLYGVEGILKYNDRQDFVGVVNNLILKELGGRNEYVVLSRTDYRHEFGDNAIWIRDEKTDFRMVESRVNQLLICDMTEYFCSYPDLRNYDSGRCPFYKVIFLDVDGVLNDEGEKYTKGVIIDPDMVDCLKYIVDQTDADIILSSSWRFTYWRYIRGEKHALNDKRIQLLNEQLAVAGLSIKGITPVDDRSGANARPLEIIDWLRRYKDIYSYVILDDDTFWKWGYLQRNVVTTQIYDSSRPRHSRWVRGLNMDHARKAVEILNDSGALIERI